MKRVGKSLALFIPVIVQGIIELGKIVVALVSKDEPKKKDE